MRAQLAVLIIVWLVFTTYTLEIVAGHGYTGFLTLALAEAWAGQMLADLVIGMSLFMIWMYFDSRERSLPFWPYVGLIVTTASIGALAYLIHRTAKAMRAEAPGGAIPEH